MIHIHVGQDLRHGHGMRNVLVTGSAGLPFMGFSRVFVGGFDEVDFLVFEVGEFRN